MTRTWLSIRVDLVEGRGERLWPRPGRIFAVGRGHTFAALATAIDDAFARWDLAHLHEFRLADGSRLTLAAREEGMRFFSAARSRGCTAIPWYHDAPLRDWRPT